MDIGKSAHDWRSAPMRTGKGWATLLSAGWQKVCRFFNPRLSA